MAACLTGLFSSLAPLLFSCFQTKGISFLSFFLLLCRFFLLCYYKDVFEMYLTELKACTHFPLSGFFYLVLFVLSHPTIGLTNRDTSKASSK